MRNRRPHAQSSRPHSVERRRSPRRRPLRREARRSSLLRDRSLERKCAGGTSGARGHQTREYPGNETARILLGCAHQVNGVSVAWITGAARIDAPACRVFQDSQRGEILEEFFPRAAQHARV